MGLMRSLEATDGGGERSRKKLNCAITNSKNFHFGLFFLQHLYAIKFDHKKEPL